MRLMQKLCPDYTPTLRDELEIWRASNTVFMGEDQAGCNIYGLACAALQRGFLPEIFVSENSDTIFNHTLENDHERTCLLTAQAIDKEHAQRHHIPITIERPSKNLLTRLAQEDRAILVLINDGEVGHWVVCDKITEQEVLLFDPYEPTEFSDENGLFHVSWQKFLRLSQINGETAFLSLTT